MKVILRTALEETLQKEADLVSELRSLPPCPTFNCSCNLKIANTLSLVNEESSTSKASEDSNNPTDSTNNSKNIKTKAKGKNKKRKIKKDSPEDFVFPKKNCQACLSFGFVKAELKKRMTYKPSVQIRTTCQLTPNGQSKPLTLSKVPATPLVTDIESTPTNFIHIYAHNTRPTLLELFQIISNLVKKNPKILDLLTKFKKANSDEEKTCLLAEAIMDKV
ncbi:hypothetical protein TNCV_1855731 [Trichonephila clavipes]|nr:hypothetical protein TNCV_1855731 [Trichonephila clavipes]